MWTYFIQVGFDGPIKIGRADDPEKRLSQLQTGSPDLLRLIGKIKGDRESDLHNEFSEFRLRGEWFSPDVRLLTFILEYSDSCDEIDGIIDVAKHLIMSYERSRPEVYKMWHDIACSKNTTGGHCEWPHLRAFYGGIDVLRKRVAAYSKRIKSNYETKSITAKVS